MAIETNEEELAHLNIMCEKYLRDEAAKRGGR